MLGNLYCNRSLLWIFDCNRFDFGCCVELIRLIYNGDVVK